MDQRETANDFARVLKSALNKGTNEQQLTVNELVKELTKQLEPLFKK